MLKILILSLLISSNLYAETGSINIVPLENSKNLQAEDKKYKILKLEAKVNELTFGLDEANKKIEILDNGISDINQKLNNLINKQQTSLEFTEDDNNDEFLYGYNMLLEGNFERAKRSFSLFLEKYPKDPKIGELYFWLGEIAYTQKNYKDASKNFLISYRDYKNNKRAHEALFKLSLSLDYLGQKDESCGGFDLLIQDRSVTKALQKKSFDEATKVGCRN